MFVRWQLFFSFLIVSAHAHGQTAPEPIRDFLSDQCLDCHDGQEAEAGLDLADWVDPQATVSASQWVPLVERVREHEMPPADYAELSDKEVKGFVSRTTDWVRKVQRAEDKQFGRVRARRLTKSQLERTLHDLLAIDIPLASLMPEEQRVDGFFNIADGQPMSHFQLESHLTVVDAALDEAFRRAGKRDQHQLREFNVRKLCRENPRRRCRDPEMLDGSAVVWSSTLVFYGRITSSTVPESGWYRIKFSATAKNKPKDHGVWCSVRSGLCTSGAPLMSWIGSFEATEDPSEQVFEAWIPAGHMLEIRPADGTLKRARFRGGQVGAGEGTPQKVPGLAMHEMTMERIHPGGDVAKVRANLFGELEVQSRRGKINLAGKPTLKSLKEQLRRFSARAFRRPPGEAELQPYAEMLTRMIEQDHDPIESLKACYRAVLCSPRFLYFTETPGPLDHHAIASRLSYLLWNRMPDEELFTLAEQKKLRDPEVLRGQVRRMLSGDRATQFVKDFASQWLDLVDIDFTEPDRKLYRDFDVVVQNSMLDETHVYLTELLRDNASIAALVDSDYTFLNSRLARFYGIEGVDGDELRQVALPGDSNRGGLMSHGSVLKVTANGTNTSPVLRGIWVSERILGVPIPPPPASVPAIEPDIRGAKTIRQQLERHLADAQCANCHKKIDPPGFALENFDASGQWREKYVTSSGGKYRAGATIDASSKLADGRKFSDFNGFRSLLAERIEPIAGNVAEKLLVYGTGAPIRFTDRETVDAIVRSCEQHDYGFRSLLEAVVVSPIFLEK